MFDEPSDITQARDKAAFLTQMRMRGQRFRHTGLNELVKGKNTPERVAARHAYWARVHTQGAKEFMDAMRIRI